MPLLPATSCRAIIDALDDGVVVVGVDRRILHLNGRAEELLDLPRESAIGAPCEARLACDACREACPLLAEGEPKPRAYVCAGWLHKTTSIVRDDAGEVVALIEILRGERPLAGDPGRAPEASPLRDLAGRSPAIRRVADTVRRLSGSDVPVLITGESGTGKELVARALHDSGRRRGRPFVAANCGALPAELAESELFGHVRGAFTGAFRDRVGMVEAAEGGTFLLDEIGDLPLSLQTKLLRLLQEKTYQRVGESVTRRADVRIVAATHVDLQRAAAEGRFREDLLYRLRVVPISLPPLRDRIEDIAPLASMLLSRRAIEAGRLPMKLSRSALDVIERYAWPGNVRELINVLDYVVALCPGEMVEPGDLPEGMSGREAPAAPGRGRYVRSADPDGERDRIAAALRDNGHHRQRTAAALGMDRVTLYRKMKELGLDSGSR